MSEHDDFEREASPGLPEPLPEGERVLWQGSPDWRALAIHALHLRKVAIYFGLLILWVVAAGIHDGMSREAITLPVNMLTLLGAVVLGVLALLAWAFARSTIFTVTDRRLVVRFGVALRLTLNVPFEQVDEVGLRRHRDGSGDITIRLNADTKISWVILWPFVRPWRLRSPEIMLRSLYRAPAVAALLGERLKRTGPAAAAVPARDPALHAPALAVAAG